MHTIIDYYLIIRQKELLRLNNIYVILCRVQCIYNLVQKIVVE